jgi:hypothetical protein
LGNLKVWSRSSSVSEGTGVSSEGLSSWWGGVTGGVT